MASLLVIVLVSISALLFPGSAAAASPLSTTCSGATNSYTPGCAFQDNLHQLLWAVTAQASAHGGFAYTAVGHASSAAFGIAMCYAEATQDECHRCLASAPTDIAASCPSGKEATIWYEACFLHYSDHDFYSQADSQIQFSLVNVNNISASEQPRFSFILGDLLGQLSASVAEEPEFVVEGSIGVDANTTVYGLMQCTQDLRAGDCADCVKSMALYLPNCCTTRLGARLFSPSCYLRFEVSKFY